MSDIVKKDKDFFSRRILMAAIQDRAKMTEMGLQEQWDVVEEFGEEQDEWDRCIVGRILDDLSISELKRLNDALERRGVHYKHNPRSILREIINIGIMLPGEMDLFYVQYYLPTDVDLMSKVWEMCDNYSPHQVWVPIVLFVYGDYLDEYNGCEVEFKGQVMLFKELRQRFLEFSNERDMFVTVIFAGDPLQPARVELNRRVHGVENGFVGREGPELYGMPVIPIDSGIGAKAGKAKALRELDEAL